MSGSKNPVIGVDDHIPPRHGQADISDTSIRESSGAEDFPGRGRDYVYPPLVCARDDVRSIRSEYRSSSELFAILRGEFLVDFSL